MKKIKRQYIHCEQLEEAPMWGSLPPKNHALYAERACNLFAEIDCFELACRRVLEEWPNSAMQNLSARALNRLAWLGQAACYIETGSVEYTTRMGWRMLDFEERAYANNTAQKVIEWWELQQCQK